MRTGPNCIKPVWTNSHSLHSHFGFWKRIQLWIMQITLCRHVVIWRFISRFIVCYFLPYRWFLHATDHAWKYNTTLFHVMMQFTFKPPMEVNWLNAHSMRIVVNAHSVWTQTTRINLLPMRITFIVWTRL